MDRMMIIGCIIDDTVVVTDQIVHTIDIVPVAQDIAYLGIVDAL